MKKLIVACLLTLTLLCVCAFACAETTTVMMYMCGTDLQQDCIRDMNEMCQAPLPDGVNVVIQAGGASQWDDSQLTPNSLNRFHIENGGFADMEVLPGDSMGDENTLLSFLQWAIPANPADRYILILWDHGGGSDSGICFDETADSDGLTIHEVSNALYAYQEANPGFRLDILGCDACLMATYEMAAHMSFYADYMVASEELEPWLGWNYLGWMTALSFNPDMDSQSLAVAIADAYMEACLQDNPNSYYSQSVIYLPAVQKLVEYMESYSAYLNEALKNGQIATISRARQRMYAFGDFEGKADSNNNMVDFMAFLDATRSIAPNTAGMVEAAFKRAVRYNVGTSTFDYLSGMSIYMPYGDTSEFLENFEYNYECQEYLPNFSEFVHAYATMLAGSDFNFTGATPSQLDSELASGNTYTGNMMNTIFTPSSSYTAPEDEQVAPDAEDEDITSGLPDVTSASSEMEGVTVGGIMPAQSSQSAAPTVDENAAYACSMTITQDELNNLSMAEGVLYMDGSDEETTFYIEMGTMQNAYVNWETGEIVSGFDGTWPMLDGQIVTMYDQIISGDMRRSYITVRCNGVDGFLLMTFNAAHPEGVIAGFTRGVDDNGLPVRGATQLKPGDEILPTYNVLYADEEGEFQETVTEGDPITVGEDATIPFEFLSLVGGETNYLYCFRLTDIFGDSQLTDFISFAM